MGRTVLRVLPCSIFDAKAFASWLDIQCKDGYVLKNTFFCFASFEEKNSDDSYVIYLQSAKYSQIAETRYTTTVPGMYRICYVQGEGAPIISANCRTTLVPIYSTLAVLCEVFAFMCMFGALAEPGWLHRQYFWKTVCGVLLFFAAGVSLLPSLIPKLRGTLHHRLYRILSIAGIILFILVLILN